MHRLSMNELTTFRWSFDQDVQRFRDAGYTAIGVWRQKLSDFGEERGIELLAESGLRVSNLLWAGGFTGSDGRSFAESVDDALEAIELAAQLRAGCLVVHSGGRAGHTHNHAHRIVRQAFRELIPAADQHGLVLAVEPMPIPTGHEWTIFSDLDQALDWLNSLETSRVQLAFDTYHLGSQPGIVERVPDLISRIAVVHLGDGRMPTCSEQERCRLGNGHVPLNQLLPAFNRAGYQGFFDIELMGEEIEQCDYEQLLRDSRAAFARLAAQ